MIVGDKAFTSKEINVNDILKFSDIVGDKNPLHIDPVYAKSSIFGTQIAQGMLIGSLISGVLGTKLPGPGCIYLEQTLKFLHPVKIGDYITAIVEVQKIHQKTNSSIIKLHTWCINQDNEVVVDGQATMKL
jgi:acyl dehydratase